MKFPSPKHALGWAVARRRPGLAALTLDAPVQETKDPKHVWIASAVFSALGRACGDEDEHDPHGALADELIAWATRSDHDVDELGRSHSTHPVDLAAEALAEQGASDEAVEATRLEAAASAARVREVVSRLEEELQALGLLAERSAERAGRRWYSVTSEGRLLRSWRFVERPLSDDEEREQAELAELSTLPLHGPKLPPRTLAGARLFYESSARAIVEGRSAGSISTLRELDSAVARWAPCSERTARTQRVNVWKIRGRAGRPGKKDVDSINWASQGEEASDSCARMTG